jgi:hypothetical protein
MNHHASSWMQIDWQEENVSTAAHVINPTGRTGNASVGLPWADKDVEISDDCDREPHPRIFLALAHAV